MYAYDMLCMYISLSLSLYLYIIYIYIYIYIIIGCPPREPPGRLRAASNGRRPQEPCPAQSAALAEGVVVIL